MASSPHATLGIMVKELQKEEDRPVIAVFEGEIEKGVPSIGPEYYIYGTLYVSRIVSVDHGTCGHNEKAKSK